MFSDVSLAPFAPGNPQIHDFSPGDLNPPNQPDWFESGGVFWTMPISRRETIIRPRRGNVWLHSPQLLVKDYTDFGNSVLRNEDGTPAIPTTPAVTSVSVIWKGKGPRRRITSDGTDHSGPFFGNFRAAEVLLAWRAASLDGYWVSANSRDDDHVDIAHAFTARLRNGVFA